MASEHNPGETPMAGESEPALSTAGGVPFVPPLAPAGVPVVLGYEVVRLVGQGGMGVVYEARQLGLGRAVALKLIRSGLAGPEEVARFLAEARALAAVEHPHVVRVHEAGRHGEAPYMAMEHVAGGSLADRLRRGPLPPAEAARLVEQAARGVQAAHEAGIVHRDLKPSNVLLTADGEAKVGDFGLARRVEGGPELTRSGVVMGTPGYMAPEQARGDAKRVGPAADVYGLGAVLYECLTGRPPFVGPQAVDVLLQVVSDEPVAVRALAPRAPRDLETICLTALRKGPARRYASAAALADDLRRFRDGRPIVARPVGVFERAWKWARRHPAVTALLAVIVLGVAVAFAAVKAEQLRTAAEQERTAKERDRAVEAERGAKDNFEQARKAVDECFGLAKDDPLLQAEHLRGVRKLLLEKTLPFYQGFLTRAPDDPALAARRAEYLLRVAEITGEVGSQAEAVAQFEQARDVYDRLSRERPEVRDHQAWLAFTCTYLGYLQGRTGKPAEARASLDRAVGLWGALRRADPNEPRYQAGLGQAYHNLAMLLAQAGKAKEAAHYNLKALDVRLRLVKSHPEAAGYQLPLAQTWNNLGNVSFPSDHTGALLCYEESLAIKLKLSQSAPSVARYRWDLAVSYANLALAQQRMRMYTEAEANYRRALELKEQLVQAYPEVTDYQDLLANTWNNLGVLQGATGRPREAITSYEKARDGLRALSKARLEITTIATRLADPSINLGNIFARELGDAERGLVHYGEAISHLEAFRRRRPAYNAFVWGRLVSAYRFRARALGALGRHRDAAADFEAAYQLGRDPRRLTFLCEKATALARAGDVAPAELLAGDGELARKLDPEGLYRLAVLNAVLARSAAGAARPLPLRERDAEAHARRAVAALEMARRAGWFRDERAREDMNKDKDLDILRGRADFPRWPAGKKG